MATYLSYWIELENVHLTILASEVDNEHVIQLHLPNERIQPNFALSIILHNTTNNGLL